MQTFEDDSKHDDFLDNDDFIMQFLDSTACQGFLSNNESVCLSACNDARFEQKMEMFTHCRRPLNFLSLFQEHPSEKYEDVVPGVYMTPKDCEYCGAKHTKDCDPRTCTRPALYFQKKRPPFAKPVSSQWDPVTGHAIERTNSSSAKKDNDDDDDSRRSYFRSFF